jgi:predicted AlkP superfamily pyrophosphatase or phosphodiesterase
MSLLPVKAFLPLFYLLASLFATTLRGEAQADGIVVLISVDGLGHYYFDDPKAEMPTIRELAAVGVRAKSVVCSMPTVTWPNHTTLVTGVHPGRHGVVSNSYWDRVKGEVVPLIPDPLFDKDEIVKVPTIYDVAKRAGLKTAGIIWPATRGAKTLDWTVPDVFKDELFQKYSTASLLAEFKEVGIPYEKQEEWCKTGKGEDRDRMYVQMLNHIVRKHRPQLALLHLVEVDHVCHAKGPHAPEAYAAVKFADDRVREVCDELKKSFPGKATLIVVSDHGFLPYQQQIQPNVLLRKEGLVQVDGKKVTGGQARAVNQGGATFLYVLDEANRDALTERVAGLFRAVEGVALVLTPDKFKEYGMVDPRQDPRMPDIILSAKSGYSFSDSLAGDLLITPKNEEVKGTHGYDPNESALHGSFVAWGAGVKSAAKLGTISNTDVAPTMAALLGVKLEGVDGKVLTDALQK